MPSGSSLTSIARKLEDERLIASADSFLLRAKILGSADPIKAGEFLLPAGSSPASILDTLQHGEAIRRFVTIPEGLPSIMVWERLMAEPLLTGKVAVETLSGQSEMVLPKEMTTYNQRNDALKKSNSKASMFSWREGVIVFDNANFDDVSQYLSRWYNVDFIVEKGFKVRGFYTGKFTRETLKNVLNGISYSSHFRYRIVGQKVFISKPN